jgi:hypothetical protein
MTNNNQYTFKELQEIEKLLENINPKSELWNLQSKDIVFNIAPNLLKQLQAYIHHNQELQSLDGLQNLAIERLNKEINLLRESLFVLEQQNKLMLVQQTSP